MEKKIIGGEKVEQMGQQQRGKLQAKKMLTHSKRRETDDTNS